MIVECWLSWPPLTGDHFGTRALWRRWRKFRIWKWPVLVASFLTDLIEDRWPQQHHKTQLPLAIKHDSYGLYRSKGRAGPGVDSIWPGTSDPRTKDLRPQLVSEQKLILTEDYLFRLVGKFIWLGPERLQSSSRYDREYMTITTVKLDTIWHWQNISTLLSNIKLLDVNEISLSAVPCIFQAV